MVGRSILTIGNFDGVHIGHRAIIERARQLADTRDVCSRVLSFEPHPATVLRPGSEPPRLNDAEEKIRLIREAGCDEVRLLVPRRQLLDLAPETFIEQLVAEHRPLAIVEGNNFRFGKDRRGDMNLIGALGDRHGFEGVVVPSVEVVLKDQLAALVSSSLLRWLIGHGRVVDAARCLGRPYALSAGVVAGEKRGRAIGVPTANLDAADLAGRMIPAEGVYGGFVRLAGETAAGVRPAAISVGSKPTFARTGLCVEAHLLDFDGELYGHRIEVRFTRWLRDQQPFPGIEALRDQLHRDIASVASLHAQGVLGMAPRHAAAG